MKVRISPSRLEGAVKAPPSKSFAHRALICSALADGKSTVRGISESEDMAATLDCIAALGAKYHREGSVVTVWGRNPGVPTDGIFNCRESGSTLRFMIPVSLTGGRERFEGTERLMARGVGIYEDILGEKGIEIKKLPDGIEFDGYLPAGEYVMRGDLSSQFVTGLLLALPEKAGDSVIKVLPPVESRPYIDVTLSVLSAFGITVHETEPNVFAIPGGQRYAPREYDTEGDWSNAAALAAFNNIGGRLDITGLNYESVQGDKICLEYLNRLREPGAEIDIKNCPDLGPVLFAAAAAAGGGAHFTGTRRLRIKESDRAAAMAQELAAFGVKCTVGDNDVTIMPSKLCKPNRVLSSHNDHRIVMAMTLLLSITGGELDGAQAVRKSYPDYFKTLASLGLEINYEA